MNVTLGKDSSPDVFRAASNRREEITETVSHKESRLPRGKADSRWIRSAALVSRTRRPLLENKPQREYTTGVKTPSLEIVIFQRHLADSLSVNLFTSGKCIVLFMLAREQITEGASQPQ